MVPINLQSFCLLIYNYDHTLYIVSVYSPFSNRVGLPLHNILSPFLSVMDIFFVDLKFCHICFYTLQPCPSWSSSWSSALNSTKLHTFLHPVLITCLYHLSYHSNDSCDNDNSNKLSQFFISFVLLSFMEIPHIHLIICSQTLTQHQLARGLVSLP